jgi:hypothetical protein
VTNYDQTHEQLRQRFAMLHLAWNNNINAQTSTSVISNAGKLRRDMYILAGALETWRGILNSKQYHFVKPMMFLDGGLAIGIARDVCRVLILHDKTHVIEDSIATELMRISVELLEMHVLEGVDRDFDFESSMENLIHILCRRSNAAWQIASDCVDRFYSQLSNSKEWEEHLGDVGYPYFINEYQSLIDLVGPTVYYTEGLRIGTIEPQGEDPDWANSFFLENAIDDWDHMSCKLCWSNDSPEVVANAELRARNDQKS